jgi:hypothetical protein
VHGTRQRVALGPAPGPCGWLLGHVDEVQCTQPLWEVNLTLARFVLLVACHDVVEGADGALTPGKKGSHPTLTCEAWLGPRFATIEHIAPRSKAKGWSPSASARALVRAGSTPQSTAARPTNRRTAPACTPDSLLLTGPCLEVPGERVDTLPQGIRNPFLEPNH